jgi:hypothetical protein
MGGREWAGFEDGFAQGWVTRKEEVRPPPQGLLPLLSTRGSTPLRESPGWEKVLPLCSDLLPGRPMRPWQWAHWWGSNKGSLRVSRGSSRESKELSGHVWDWPCPAPTATGSASHHILWVTPPAEFPIYCLKYWLLWPQGRTQVVVKKKNSGD